MIYATTHTHDDNDEDNSRDDDASDYDDDARPAHPTLA